MQPSGNIFTKATDLYREASHAAQRKISAIKDSTDAGEYLVACDDALSSLEKAHATNLAIPAQEEQKAVKQVLTTGMAINGVLMTGLALLTPMAAPAVAFIGAVAFLATAVTTKKYSEHAWKQAALAIKAAQETPEGTQARAQKAYLKKQHDKIQYDSAYFQGLYTSACKNDVAARFPRLCAAFNRYDKGTERRAVFIATNPYAAQLPPLPKCPRTND